MHPIKSGSLLSRAVIGALSAAVPAASVAAEAPDLNALQIEQLMNLEVITASKIPQKISEVPSSVSVITADDIRRYGYRTLGDILRSVRGMYVSYDRNYSYVGTRGAGFPGDFNTRLLLLVDGRRQNDMVYTQSAVGTEFPVEVSLIERIEVVAGPGSAMYGSNALFGVINVITKTGAAYKGTALTVSRASANSRHAQLTTGHRSDNGVDLLLGASWFDREGKDLYFPEYDDPDHHFGVAQGLDYDRAKRAFAKLSFGKFTLAGYFGRRTKGVPTGSYGQQFNDTRSYTTDEYGSASATYQTALSNTLEFYSNVNVNKYYYRGAYIYERDSKTVNIDTAGSRTITGEARLLSTGFRNHKIIVGAEYVRDVHRMMFNHDIDPYEVKFEHDQPNTRGGVYLQDEFRLGERWIFNSGLRYDFDSEGGNNTNPRVALIYKASPFTTLKALYGTAFRLANSFERYFGTAMGYKRNPNQRPEHIKTFELTGEYFPTENFRASASLFQYRLSDLIALMSDPADNLLHYVNIDSARSKGAEFEAEWLAANGSALKASASFQDAHNELTGEWLTNSPRRLYKLNYTIPLWREKLRAGIDYQFTSRRKTSVGGEVPDFGVVNLTLLSHSFNDRLEISASVYNVLDKQHADSPSEEHYDNSDPVRHLQSIRQDGRNWRIQASYRF